MFSKKIIRELFTFLVFHVISIACFYEEKEQTKYYTAKLNISVFDPKGKRFILPSESGNFGIHSPIKIASGWLYQLSDSNEHGCKIFNVRVDNKPWIALVKRGSCRFTDKINNAYVHNASAIIIYNNEDSDAPTINNEGSSSIVSISISKNLGETLIEMMDQNKTMFVQITKGTLHTNWQVNPTSILFVSVSFIVLMVISLAWLVFYYVQRFRYVHARDKTEVSIKRNC